MLISLGKAKGRAQEGYPTSGRRGIIGAGAPAFGCAVHPLRLQAPRAAYAHKSPGQGDCTATPGEKVLPRDLQPTQSVRFVTNEVRLHELLERAGPRGPSNVATFRIGVLDHRDRWHTSTRIR